MSLEKEIAELIANEVSWFNGWKASEEMFNKSCRKAARKVIKRLTKRSPDKAKAAAFPNSVDAAYRVSKKKSLANPPCG